MTTPLLDLEALDARYGDIAVLHGVGLQVMPGQVVALLGSNGAGKTTLMKAVIGLVHGRRGRIRLDGAAIEGLRPDRRARLGIGYCPEGRRIFPGLSVVENLQVACFEAAAECARRVEEIFALFPQLQARAGQPGWQLSGGQQQMLAIGRSLMARPRLLLLDEPSLGLSPRLTDEVIDLIPTIQRLGTAVLLAEQNARKALQVCDMAWVLRTGQVVRHGPAAELAVSDDVRAAFLGA